MHDSPPRIIAKLDLTDERHRAVIELIHNTHGKDSRSLWRCLAMKREGDRLYEVAQWFPNRRSQPRFGLLLWDLAGPRLLWTQPIRSREAALCVLSEKPASSNP